ncbi:hypothetical protein NEAUS04_1401 [Nematocida ausubeli]|uniref:Uncharacterized protein n=1 Tax=Nematocida ausubeli (strain ATCC PRA-371 / ERTm2) TaxID=1913371 RepID=A0A086J3V7_NEMA1|nr:uncharacterized protein NESG_00981 [Nematocida ausubeli]KAI5163174.1 hypothetical protein NEAUS04_1401 [Nematocida ausubeli]KFG26825.1 hypothetical protein NESG_00981 [Nematocida ausubeli]
MLDKKQKLNTELLRYAVSTGIFGIGMSLNLQSPAAIMNMHSARIFLNIQEMREQWMYSGLDTQRAITTAGSIVSSAAILISGHSRVSRVAESTYLALEAVGKVQQWLRIRRIARSSAPASTTQISEMYSKATFSTVIALVELFSYMFSIWPIYLLVAVLKGGHFLYRSLSSTLQETLHGYSTGKKKIHFLINSCFT